MLALLFDVIIQLNITAFREIYLRKYLHISSQAGEGFGSFIMFGSIYTFVKFFFPSERENIKIKKKKELLFSIKHFAKTYAVQRPLT